MIQNRKKIFTSSFADEEPLVSSDNSPRNGGEDTHEPKSTSKLIMALVLFMTMIRFMTLLTFQNQNEFDNIISKLSQLTENGPAIEISVMMILFYKNVPMTMIRFMTLLTFQNQNEFDNIISKLSQLTENGPAIEISVMMILFYKNEPALAKVPMLPTLK